MTKTNTSENINQRRIEKREARLRQTKQYILSNSVSGLLNNQKWHRLFEWFENKRSDFEIRILMTSEERKCNWIRELEHTSLLIDDSGDFIEFYEIESVSTKKTNELANFLESSKMDFYDNSEEIEIYGYKTSYNKT